MRIIAGAWRGRRLIGPAGQGTRPTADRVRQALFDMILHAPWGGRDAIEGVRVADVFAGTGALGLEALSRGAAFATFVENERAALAALRANIEACAAAGRSRVLAADALALPRGEGCGLVFLDPPYGGDLVMRAVTALRQRGWLAPGALVAVETAAVEDASIFVAPLVSRVHGAARITVWREEV